MKTIVHYWYSKHPILFLLLPLSYLYRLGFFIHKYLYRSGIISRYQAKVPVIIVGNITVGGTGKTPLVIELAKFLLRQGYRPGIISRGYKGKKTHYPHWVLPSSDPRFVGDEAVLIAKKTGCPVVVASKRSHAVKMILELTDCDLIIGDDGLQHHALKRDLELVVVDGDRQYGNGFCLPAGPLREPLRKLAQVDFIIETNGHSDLAYRMTFIAERIVNLVDEQVVLNLSTLSTKTIHAVAGIGHPDRFFNMLCEMGLQIVKHPFPDHHCFCPEDLAFCQADEIIIMTEKDAVKCCSFAKNNYWMLPIHSHVAEAFFTDFLNRLKEIGV